MSLVILQPAGNDVARTNYAKTVKRPVDLERVRTHVPELHKQLLELHPEGAAPIWGVKARNRKPWGRIQRGDVTLFARDNAVFSAGVVTLRILNEPLALESPGP